MSSLTSSRPRLRAALATIVATLLGVAGLIVGPASPAQAQLSPFSSVPQINTSQVDLGLLATSTTAPDGAAVIAWNRSGNGNAVSPVLFGYLSLHNATGSCSTVRMTYYRATGNTLVTWESPQVCAIAPGVFGQRVTAGSPNSPEEISGWVTVEVGLYPLGGTWQPYHTTGVYAY